MHELIREQNSAEEEVRQAEEDLKDARTLLADALETHERARARLSEVMERARGERDEVHGQALLEHRDVLQAELEEALGRKDFGAVAAIAKKLENMSGEPAAETDSHAGRESGISPELSEALDSFLDVHGINAPADVQHYEARARMLAENNPDESVDEVMQALTREYQKAKALGPKVHQYRPELHDWPDSDERQAA